MAYVPPPPPRNDKEAMEQIEMLEHRICRTNLFRIIILLAPIVAMLTILAMMAVSR